MSNRERALAKSFILHTGRNIFLTGKAGTGKTTLLKEVLKETSKNTVVVAPTGVAAVNAGGVTIHSMFQLPITTFLPVGRSSEDPDVFTDRNRLSSNQRIRKERRNLLRELELLIIDEISMVRSDLLDAIDFTLQRIRRNQSPFGGVQILAIGDLYQLAPVVKPYEASILNYYYPSRFFFDSKVWRTCEPIVIELKKIYRQEDEAFIHILNNIRNGIYKSEDIETLNQQHTNNHDTSEIITLTTHNLKADKINQQALDKLKGKTYHLKAEVKGKFSEYAYPTPEEIIVKKGTQVMFIRNHSDGVYFNGKIGKVTGKIDDTLLVQCNEEKSPISVNPIEWKNTRYKVDKDSKKVVQEDIGQFKQYPIKLAWAVTVHKSQGLTFDRVILDLESTFAPGQLYVALSRCRTLEGLTLSSKISQKNIIVNPRIVQFHADQNLDPNIEEILNRDQHNYEAQKLLRLFNFSKILAATEDWIELIKDEDIPKQADVLNLAKQTKTEILRLNSISAKFIPQLRSIIQSEQAGKTEPKKVVNRAIQAITYYTEQIYKIIKPIQSHYEEYRVKKSVKKYAKSVNSLLIEFWSGIKNLYNATYAKQKIWQKEETYKHHGKIKSKRNERTAEMTLQLYQKGMSLPKIALARDLTIGTIRSHMTPWIQAGTIELRELLSEERFNTLYSEFLKLKDIDKLSTLKSRIPIETEWYELRWVRAYHEWIINSKK